jgi:predicted dehydrogenase
MQRLYASRQMIDVRAVCDIYPSNLEAAVALVETRQGTKPEAGFDFRKTLAAKDVEAVFLAAPEHLHHEMLLTALESGKHVYLDGCLGRTPEQFAGAMQAWRQSDLVVQVGLQNRSHELYQRAKELIASGTIGRVFEVRAFHNQVSPDRDPQWAAGTSAVLPAINWYAFLGSAPRRDLEYQRLFRWRNYEDYTFSVAADLLCHQADSAAFVCGRTAPPASCNASGAHYSGDGSRELPDQFGVLYDYGDGLDVGISLRLNEPGPSFAEEFIGENGSVRIQNGQVLSVYRRKWSADGVSHPRILELQLDKPEGPEKAQDSHITNFLEAVRGRECPATPPPVSYSCMIAAYLAAASYRSHARAFRTDTRNLTRAGQG